VKTEGATPRRDVGGMVFAALFVLLGAYALWDTQDISPLGSVFPVTMASAMMLLSLLYIGVALARPGPARERDSGESTPRRVLLVVVLFAWVASMPWLGFALSGLGGFLLLAAVAHHDPWTPRRTLVYGLVGVAVVAGFQALFAIALKVPLPKSALF
jgi:putative tricarboxylic transport membrane protein